MLALVAKTERVEPKYFSTTETAGLIRKALKAAFPTVTFSVRSKSYSGGSSINVSWTDGPTGAEVELVAGRFSGATFDGMVDLKSYHESEFEGQRVRFGADFVFCNRVVSVALLGRALVYVNRKYGWDIPASAIVESGRYSYVTNQNDRPFGNHYDKSEYVSQVAHTMRADGIIVRVNVKGGR